MAYSTRLIDYLGQGLASARPATPNVPSSAVVVYIATDTGAQSIWANSAWATLGGTSGTLVASNNLSDLGNVTTARSNLGLGTAALLASDNDTLLAADSATRLPTQHAVKTYVDAGIATVSGTTNGAPLNGVVSGCGIAYSGTSLTFYLSAGTFYILGDLFSASAQSITLAAADPTNPRIDVLYLDNTGTLGKITGTAAASPSQPAVDPTTQLYLTFVLVPAAATTLTGITNTNIYLEGSEWTPTAVGSGIAVNSTNNPYAGTKCVEATAMAAAAYAKFVNGSPISFDGDGNLTFRIRSKASWAAKRVLSIQWLTAGVAKGAAVSFKNGTYGFDSSITASYQLIVIPKTSFAIPAGTSVDEVRFTDGGGSIGFYLDDIILQNTGTSTSGSGTGTSSGLTQAQADARYNQRANNLSDVGSVTTARSNLGLAIGSNVQAWDADLDALAALGGTNTIYYRSAANTWSAVIIGTNLTFTGGTLSASGSTGLTAANNLSDVSSASTSRTNLGATTVGSNLFTLTNPSAITFPRINADNSVSALSASAFRTAIGAGTGTGDLVASNNLSDLVSATTALTNLGLTANGKSLVTAANYAAMRTLLNLVAGTDIQAYNLKLATIAANTVSSQSGTAYTAVLGDADTYIQFSNASAISFTIPPNSSVAFPIGTVIEVEQSGAGALTLVAGAGVTLNSRAADLTLAGQYSVAFAKKVATNTWTVNGDL